MKQETLYNAAVPIHTLLSLSEGIPIACYGVVQRIEYLKRINNIREKLTKETQMSLDLADRFLGVMDEKFYNEEFDYTQFKIHYVIHIDAGHNGKTNVLIPELVGWVNACGYDATVKPESFAASSIANKYSK